MKKYVKPELIYESFELSQQIAACDYDSKNTQSNEGCTFIWDFDPGVVIFNHDKCNTPAESYCYHASSGSLYILSNS